MIVRQSAVQKELRQSLPSCARTRSGVRFSPHEDVWRFRDGVTTVSMNFESVALWVNEDLVISLKLALVWILENKAPSTANAIHSTFLHFLRALKCSEEKRLMQITSSDLINYRSQLTIRQVTRLSTLTVLLRKWSELNLVGVALDAIKLLDDLKMKAPPRGEAVRTMCPIAGPLSQLEDESFQYGLNAAFAAGKLQEDEFFAIWITRALGQRPSQSAALKVCDLIVVTHEDQSVEYTIQIPRAKQRDRIHPRQSFKVRPLIPQIGEPLRRYVSSLKEQFAGVLEDTQMAPMFPRSKCASSRGYEYHRTGFEMSSFITNGIEKIDAMSERTKKKLHVFPTRLRRTVGTRAAQEGHSELVIAEILDHSNIASSGYYVEAVPEIAIRIDESVAKTLAPIAKAFSGRVLERTHSTQTDAEDQILDLRIDQSGKSMGACCGGSCSFNAPIACYTCRSFRPWSDGPHQAVLDFLIARRQQLMQQTDERIASINDRTILAVSEVIALCKQVMELS